MFMAYFQKYENTVDGLESIVTDGNVSHPYRAILRDSDSGETVAVIFGSLESCYVKAMHFIGTPERA